MATTKALELGQFGTDLTVDDSTGAVTIANDVTVNAATSTGIDDNADQTVITIDNNEKVTIAGILEVTEIGNNNTGLITIDVDATAHAMLRFQEASSDLWRIVKEPTNELVIDQGAGNIDFTFSTSGDFTVHDGDVIIETGGIKGPSVLYIDPATYDTDSDAGTAAGTVRIRGDLIVDGDTTTINSTTLTVDDLNIVLASGAADAASADGAGITVDGANATITYDGTNDEWDFNKNINVTGTLTTSSSITSGNDIYVADTRHLRWPAQASNSSAKILFGDTSGTGGSLSFLRNSDAANLLTILGSGNVGIGTDDPWDRLTVYGGGVHFGTAPTDENSGRLTYDTISGDMTISAHSTGGNTNMNFITSDAGAQGVKLHITPTGNVNVGTSLNDTAKLWVEGGYGLTISNSDTPSAPVPNSIQLYEESSGLVLRGENTNDGTNFAVKNKNSDEHVTVKGRGDVGIGVTDPQHNLHVSGAIGTDQVRHSIHPVLNLDFINSKELDSRVTFYRDSLGTYFDEKGVMKIAVDNEPRFNHDMTTGQSKGLLIEDPRTQLITNGTLIGGSGWSNGAGSNSQYVDMYNALAPDGTYSATLITNMNNANTDPDLYMYYNHNLDGGETITYSVWIKAADSDNVGKHVEFRGKRVGGSASSWGTVGILTAEWQRIQITHTYNADNTNIGRAYIGSRSNYGSFTDPDGNSVAFDPADNVLVWGMVAEEGREATSYIPSDVRYTSRDSEATYYDEDGVIKSAPDGSPRYNHVYDADLDKWVSTGQFIEHNGSTNLLYHSTKGADLYGDVLGAESKWTITDSSEDVTAPDGSRKTTKGVTGSSGNHFFWTTGAPVTYVDGTRYIHSTWIRAATGTGPANIDITCYPQSAHDVGPGTANGSGFRSLQVTDEWQRVSITFTYSSGSGKPYVGFVNPSNNFTYYFWGWQVEVAGRNILPASYITSKASSSAISRTADVASYNTYDRKGDVAVIYDHQFEKFYNPREGTFYADADTERDVTQGSTNRSDTMYISTEAEGTSSAVFIGPNSVGGSNVIYAFGQTNVVTDFGLTSGLSGSQDNKFAFSYSKDNFDLSVNGSAVSTDNSGNITPNLARMYIGSRYGAGQSQNGHIKKIAYYDQKLSDNEIIALTENN
jgi:hypothetical protein